MVEQTGVPGGNDRSLAEIYFTLSMPQAVYNDYMQLYTAILQKGEHFNIGSRPKLFFRDRLTLKKALLK
jgi:hypothetical protein